MNTKSNAREASTWSTQQIRRRFGPYAGDSLNTVNLGYIGDGGKNLAVPFYFVTFGDRSIASGSLNQNKGYIYSIYLLTTVFVRRGVTPTPVKYPLPQCPLSYAARPTP